jgi:hypothetical protein
LKAKTILIITLIITAIVMVYPIELSIRLSTGGSGRIEYLVVALIITALLLAVDLLLYIIWQRQKKKPHN